MRSETKTPQSVSNYLAFQRILKARGIAESRISRIVKTQVKDVAQRLFDDVPADDALILFMKRICEWSAESYPETANYFIELHKGWSVDRKKLAVAVYHYFYCHDDTLHLAREIDMLVLGKPFEEAMGVPPPGGLLWTQTSPTIADGLRILPDEFSARPATFVRGKSRKRSRENAHEISDDVKILRDTISFRLQRRASIYSKVNDFLSERFLGENSGLLRITAPAGFGKTALANDWCSEHEKSNLGINVACHFCSVAFPPTTYSEKALSYIFSQLPEDCRSAVGGEYTLATLRRALSLPRPAQSKIVLWLDGVDEASGSFPFFLPAKLGDNVAVIVSYRIEDGQSPPTYSFPFVDSAYLKSYDAVVLNVPKYSLDEVRELISHLGDDLLHGDDLKYFFYGMSEKGLPILLWCLLNDVAEHGFVRGLARGRVNQSFETYISDVYREMAQGEHWREFGPFFKVLFQLYSPHSIEFINKFLPASARIDDFHSIPNQISRWITPIRMSGIGSVVLLRQGHLSIAKTFKSEIISEGGCYTNLVQSTLAEMAAQCSDEYLKFAPVQHIIDGNYKKAAQLLISEHLYSERVRRFGDEEVRLHARFITAHIAHFIEKAGVDEGILRFAKQYNVQKMDFISEPYLDNGSIPIFIANVERRSKPRVPWSGNLIGYSGLYE